MVGEHIRIDIMATNGLESNRDSMKCVDTESIEVMRASTKFLSFRNEAFDHALLMCLNT